MDKEDKQCIPEEQLLTPKQEKQVEEFSEKIDLTDYDVVVRYGTACQKKVATFSDTALKQAKETDLAQVAQRLEQVTENLKEYKTKDEYYGAEMKIDKLLSQLEVDQKGITKDLIMYEKLAKANLTYIKELTMYINAGKLKLERAGAEESSSEAGKLFEKRLHDLELTRTITMQMVPQIKMVQNNTSLMREKIDTAVRSAIPLWKNRMAIALDLEA